MLEVWKIKILETILWVLCQPWCTGDVWLSSPLISRGVHAGSLYNLLDLMNVSRTFIIKPLIYIMGYQLLLLLGWIAESCCAGQPDAMQCSASLVDNWRWAVDTSQRALPPSLMPKCKLRRSLWLWRTREGDSLGLLSSWMFLPGRARAWLFFFWDFCSLWQLQMHEEW